MGNDHERIACPCGKPITRRQQRQNRGMCDRCAKVKATAEARRQGGRQPGRR